MTPKKIKELREEASRIELQMAELMNRRSKILETLAKEAEKSTSVKVSKQGAAEFDKKMKELAEKAAAEKKAKDILDAIEYVKLSLVDNFNLVYKDGEGVSIEDGKADRNFSVKKNALKAFGFRWSPKHFRWYVPANQWQAVAKKMKAVL